MCFETSLHHKKKEIEKTFQKSFQKEITFKPYYHKSGFTYPKLYIITQQNPQEISIGEWGFVPQWVTQKFNFRKKYNTLNAKSETLWESATYSESIITNKCLIIADGFFEPHYINNQPYPYYCYHSKTISTENSEIFAFAGLFSFHENEVTCTIITTKANPFFEEIHNKKKRMPLVLEPTLYNNWLFETNTNKINYLLKNGFTNTPFIAHPVSRNLYSKKENTYTLNTIKPIQKETLF